MPLVLQSTRKHKHTSIALITAEYCCFKVYWVPNLVSKPEHLKICPVGETALLFTPKHDCIAGIGAIARYLALLNSDNTLLGSSSTDLFQINQWIDFAMLHIDTKFSELYMQGLDPEYTVVPPEQSFYLKKSFGLLNAHLANNRYLVGHSVTLADIITTGNLSFGFTMLLSKNFTSNFPHVERYFWDMVQQLNFKRILGNVKQIEVWSPLRVLSSQPLQQFCFSTTGLKCSLNNENCCLKV